MSYELTPIIEGTPGETPTYNVGMAETFSWVPIENDSGRPLYARATYVTNMSDMTVNFSGSTLSIGSVVIKDGDSNLEATVTNIGGGQGAVKVLTQDLECENDNVTIGDASGALAKVDSTTEALQVLVKHKYGTLSSFNNFSTGWTLDGTLRPVIGIKKFSGSLVKLVNTQLFSHDATGVYGYEWWKGTVTVSSGPAEPSWTNYNRTSYRIYQDVSGSNVGNTVSTAAATLKHSGIITNSNPLPNPFENEGIGDASIWTLLVKRLDSSSEQKMHFAFTFDEYA